MTPENDSSVDRGLCISNDNVVLNSSIGGDLKEELPARNGTLGTDSAREESVLEDETTNSGDSPSSETFAACLQVFGAFFLMFNSWGIANTFGAFQTYYEDVILEEQSPSDISWIGSIQAFLLLFVGGLCTGQVYDAGYLRELVWVGSILSVFGMMMTSICHTYWQIILAQGVTVGLGAGCMLLPSVAVMPQVRNF
jgi:hypothetical protein